MFVLAYFVCSSLLFLVTAAAANRFVVRHHCNRSSLSLRNCSPVFHWHRHPLQILLVRSSPPSFLDPGYVWLVVASCCPAPSLLIPGGRSQYPADCFRHCGCYSVPPLRFRRRLIRFLFSDSFLLSRTYCVSECSPCIALCSVGGLSYIVKSIFLSRCDIFDLTPNLFLFLLPSTAAQVSSITIRCLHQLIDLV